MKRIFVIVLSIVLAFCSCFPVFVAAASNTYAISALGLKVEVTIPEEVILRLEKEMEGVNNG